MCRKLLAMVLVSACMMACCGVVAHADDTVVDPVPSAVDASASHRPPSEADAPTDGLSDGDADRDPGKVEGGPWVSHDGDTVEDWLSEEAVRQLKSESTGSEVSGVSPAVISNDRWEWRQCDRHQCLYLNGHRVYGWQSYSGNTYYFDPGTGYQHFGWLSVNGSRFYLKPDKSGVVAVGFNKIDGDWYYFSPSQPVGAMKTGWVHVGDYWYYLDPSTGHELFGWQKIDGGWFYLIPDSEFGGAAMGWRVIDGNKFYFNPEGGSGRMFLGFHKIDGYWYYFKEAGESGAVMTGWQHIGGGWCYFDSDGHELFGWQKIDGGWFYLDPDEESGWAVMGFRKIEGYWYYFKESEESGRMLTGWQKVDGDWYYFDPSTGYVLFGWQTIDGGRFYLEPTNESGRAAMGFRRIGRYWYYFDETNESGRMLFGWQKVGDYWYYLDPSTGHVRFGWQEIDGDTYFLDPTNESGRAAMGFTKIDGYWYYFKEASEPGARMIRWQKIRGKWYYFNSEGHMALGLQELGHVWYYFDEANESGARWIGWKRLKGAWHYFLDDTGVMATGWQFLSDTDGNKYTFYFRPGGDGGMVTGDQTIASVTEHFGKTSGHHSPCYVPLGGDKKPILIPLTFSINVSQLTDEQRGWVDESVSRWNDAGVGARISTTMLGGDLQIVFLVDKTEDKWYGVAFPYNERVIAINEYRIRAVTEDAITWVKSTITHELGHALRLEDNPSANHWRNDNSTSSRYENYVDELGNSSLMNHSRDRSEVGKPTPYDKENVLLCHR